MQVALEPYGLELDHAENGAIAVEKVMASPWDLIFLDVVMPIMDGPTALRELRARGNTTPVVLVTSVSTAAVVAGAVKLGGVFYIAKPFTPAHIRAVATKLLKLDPAVLGAPPRVLLQHTDPALPARLRKLLPAHVALDTSQSLAQSIDLAEAGKRDLVILESHDLLDEISAVANVIRRALPSAGIFAMSEDADPAAPWRPDEGLDGLVPRSVNADLVNGFLVPTFLRPLAVFEHHTVRVSGFRGPPAAFAAYTTMLTRHVVERCRSLERTVELELDLRTLVADPDAIVAVITEVDRALRDLVAVSSFRITPEMRAATRGRLERIALLS